MTICDQEFHSDVKYQAHSSQTFVSAIEDILRTWGLRAKSAFYQWRQHHVDRQAFSHLLSLDAHTLKDIGVTSDDVLWASQLPIHINASLELDKIARANKTNAK